MSPPCLVQQAFDTEIFGRPVFRVLRLDEVDLPRELAALAPPFMVDVKVSTDNVDGAKFLHRLGFTKICAQILLSREVTEADRAPGGATPQGSMKPAPELLDVLTANFRYNRMSLDPFLPPALAFAHQRRWLANSFALESILKFTAEQALMSFRHDDHLVRIDLVSVAKRRQGLGSHLFDQLFAWCARNGLDRIEVATESENLPAWRFYMKNGFKPVGASCVFHLHQGAWP